MKKIDSGSGLSPPRSFLKGAGALAFALPMGAFLAGRGIIRGCARG